MRLIDADALIESIVKVLGIRNEEYLTVQESVIVSEIYNAPIIEPNLILPERMERGECYEVGETIVVMNHDDYYDLLCKSMENEPKQEWIPCSERLPSIGDSGVSDMVLLCWSDGQRTVGAYQGNHTFVGQAWPVARDYRVTVVAWMPLPKPYRKEQAE